MKGGGDGNNGGRRLINENNGIKNIELPQKIHSCLQLFVCLFVLVLLEISCCFFLGFFCKKQIVGGKKIPYLLVTQLQLKLFEWEFYKEDWKKKGEKRKN